MTETKSSTANTQRLILLGGIVVVALVVAGVAIWLNTSSAAVRGAKFNYADVPQTRTADGGFVLGNPDAPITIVEFADFRCPACQNYRDTVEQVIANHVMTGEAKLEFRMLPTVDRTGFSFQLVECATEQDASFWLAHDVMYDLASRGWTQTSSQEFAERMDLNYGDLLNCVTNADQFVTDAQLGQRSGITGTPGVRVRINDGNLQPIGQSSAPAYDTLRTVIEQANQS